MDQTNSLSDAFLKSSSLLSALLSQMGSQLTAGTAENEPFSNLLTPDEMLPQAPPTVEAPLALTPQQTQTLPTSPTPALQIAQPQPLPAQVSVSSSSDQPIQNVTDILQELHKILVILHTNNTINKNTSNPKGQVAQSSSQDTDGQNQAATPVKPLTLADAITEIMALMQLIGQKLQQQQASNGGLNLTASATPAVSLTAANNALAAGTSSGTAGGTPLPDALASLLEAIEKNVEQLMAANGKPVSTDPTQTPQTLTVADAVSEITQLTASLKAALLLANGPQKDKNLTLPAPQIVDTAQAQTSGAAEISVTPSPKPVVTAPSQSLNSAATAEDDETVAAAPSLPSPTANLQNAAIAAGAVGDNGTSTNDGSNLLSGNEHSFSSLANAAALSDAGTSTEGSGVTGVYSFASTLSAFRAANGGTTGLPTAIDQVILQMNRSVKNGSDHISVQLQPGDLGKITVKLDVGSDGKVHGTVVADNPKTLDMLQKDSRSLERALQDAGMRADPGSLQFSLSGDGHNKSGETADKNQAASDGTISADETTEDGSNLLEASSVNETYYLTPTSVNIKV